MNDSLTHEIVHFEPIKVPHGDLEDTFLQSSLKTIHKDHRLLPFWLKCVGDVLYLSIQVHAAKERKKLSH